MMRAAIPAPFDRFVAPARARAALWRLGAGLAVIFACYLGLNALAYGAAAALWGSATAHLWLGKLAAATTPASALLVLASFGPLAAGCGLAAWGLHRRGCMGVGLLRHARQAVLIAAAVYLPALGLWLVFFDSAPNLPAGLWLNLLPLSILAIAVQTLAEEMLFRGYLQVQLAARFRSPLIWFALPAALFGLLHYDPSRMGAAAPLVVVSALIFGLAAADLTTRTGSIGAAWGLHFVNNFAALALVPTTGTITGLGLRVTPYAAADLAAMPVLALADLAPLALTWWILRRRLSV
ncbi:MAG: CPBP family intramembrane metalloprotease [Rhodobacteraceae bacterium]|nr:CPBP family intramembrane metalloprotease [Paracoccaceae bacterium]